jgi:hypothetical protein
MSEIKGLMEKTKLEYSASTIKTYQNCKLQHYYHKVKRPKPKAMTLLEFVRGKLLHTKIEKIYKPDGTPKYSPYSQKKLESLLSESINAGILEKVAGDFLRGLSKDGKKIKKDEKRKSLANYLAKEYGPKRIPISMVNKKDGKIEKTELILGEPFANTTAASWLEIIKKGKHYGQDIDFKEVEGKDKKALAYGMVNDIKKICLKVYETYYNSKPPILKEEKIRFAFIKNNKLYRMIAILDEIRDRNEDKDKKIVIRDHKSDYWLPEEDSFTLRRDVQFTVYPAAIGFKCSKNPEFARKIGLTENELEEVVKDPFYLMDKIKVEHHHMRTGIMTPTYRIKNDFTDVVNIMDEMEDFMNTLNPQKLKELILTAPGRKHCEKCIYRRFHEKDYFKEKYQTSGSQLLLEGLFVKADKPENESSQIEFAKKRKKIDGKWEKYFILPST